MTSRVGLATLLCLLVVGLAGAPAANAASAFTEVLKDYQSDGKIDPCAHSDTTLRDAANQVPANIEQYAPDFPSALGSAIDKRAQGACSKGGGTGGTSTTPPAATTPTTTTPTPGGAAPPATTAPPPTTAPAVPAAPSGPAQVQQNQRSEPASSDSGTSPWLYVAIAAGAAALLILAAFGLTRFMGWDGPRLAGMRQAWGEAGFRAGGTWADFRDWARFGR
jgi:hypothetical protein